MLVEVECDVANIWVSRGSIDDHRQKKSTINCNSGYLIVKFG